MPSPTSPVSKAQSSILKFMAPSTRGKAGQNAETKADALPRTAKKRPLKEEDDDDEAPASKKRSTTKERAASDPHNPVSNLVDSLRPDLTLVFIGLNPGLMTAAKGHAYAHPTNLFWRLLHWSGVTPKQHAPSETHDLPDLYSIGNTNICLRPTRSGDGLSKEELLEGAGILEEKIGRYRPEAVCIVGKSIWEAIYEHKLGRKMKKGEFSYGWQPEKMWLGRTYNRKEKKLEWAGARTFVATTTSALAANMSNEQKTDIWKPLGTWFQERRKTQVKEKIDFRDEEVEEDNKENVNDDIRRDIEEAEDDKESAEQKDRSGGV